MLSRVEELRLASILDVARDDAKKGYSTIQPQGVLWLAEKMKEAVDRIKEHQVCCLNDTNCSICRRD